MDDIDDIGLDTLLDMDGEIFPMDNGYWTKFEVKKVEASAQIPHGLSYSFTLHDKNNNRVFGIDNKHAYKPQRQKYRARKTSWDHKHISANFLPFEFESPGDLLEAFWDDVEKILEGKRS